MAKKILRWLLSNLLLILVIVSVIYCYMYWGNLTGKNTPAAKAVAFLSQKFDGVDEFIEGVKSKQARLAGAPIGEQPNKQVDQQAVAEIGADMAETEMSAVDSPENTQESLQLNNIQQDMQQDTATEQPGVADTQSISQDNDDTNASETSASNNEGSDTNQSESMLSESMGKTDSSAAVTALSNEQINTEQTNAEEDSGSVVAEQAAMGATATAPAVTGSPESEQQPASISYSHNNTRVKQNSDGAIESLPQIQTATTKTDDISKDGFISAEVADQVENVNEDGGLRENAVVEAASSSTEQPSAVQSSDLKTEMSIQDTWVLARQSFYQKKYDLSVQSYQAVIAETKDNFDAYGELGNVYFSQGKKSQAADAYLSAATILLTKGNNQRAQSLLRVLQQLDTSKANQLQHLMDMPSL